MTKIIATGLLINFLPKFSWEIELNMSVFALKALFNLIAKFVKCLLLHCTVPSSPSLPDVMMGKLTPSSIHSDTVSFQ